MPRSTAEDRRREIRAAATDHFARAGLHGVSIKTIAASVGISEAYVFRLFGSKRDLFVDRLRAAYAELQDGVEQAGRQSAGLGPAEVLTRMGEAYVRLLHDRGLLLLQLQGFAACSDPVVQQAVRECFGRLWTTVADLSGADPADVKAFVGLGTLNSVLAAVEVEEGGGPWAVQASAFVPLG